MKMKNEHQQQQQKLNRKFQGSNHTRIGRKKYREKQEPN